MDVDLGGTWYKDADGLTLSSTISYVVHVLVRVGFSMVSQQSDSPGTDGCAGGDTLRTAGRSTCSWVAVGAAHTPVQRQLGAWSRGLLGEEGLGAGSRSAGPLLGPGSPRTWIPFR